MLDKKHEAPPDPAADADANDQANAQGAARNPPEDTGEYFNPSGTNEPLLGRSQAPQVKRFNRKTVAVLLAAMVLIAALAFGTALSRRPPGLVGADSAAQKTPASSTATDSINSLPSDYSQIKRPPPLGAPIPGDIGAIAQASGHMAAQQQSGAATGPRPLTALEQYEMQQALERAKRADRAREGGFSFVNNGAGGAGLGGSDQVAEAQRMIAAGLPGARPGGLMPTGATAGEPSTRTARDDDNRQDDKSRFMNDRTGRFDLAKPEMQPRSPYTIFGGTSIPGVLITGINSDLPGQIKGQISQNVYDTVTGQHLLLPQGTSIVGQYDSRVTYGQSRVLIVWTRLIRPDGSNIDLEGMPGVDLSGYAGLTGDVDRHIWRLLTAVVLGSVIQAGTQAGSSVNSFGGSTSFSDAARQGIGSGVNDATQQIVRKELNIQPTITVAPGERFNIFTTKDIIMTPYKS